MSKTLQIKQDYDKPFFKHLETDKPVTFGNNKNKELYKIIAKKL